MTGNVFEWVWDWYGDYPYKSQNDPYRSESGDYRVNRGGSWPNNALYARVANRNRNNPGYRGNHIGFRLVLPVAPAGP